MLLSLIRMIQAFRDYQRNVSELSQLSDRELADIGLDRSDIPRVAAGTYNGCSVFQPTIETDNARLSRGRCRVCTERAHSTAARNAVPLCP